MTLPTIKLGNIWSGSKTFAVFTNPTELAYRKGNLKHHYPIVFNGGEIKNGNMYINGHIKPKKYPTKAIHC